jgi:hypothetical protein
MLFAFDLWSHEDVSQHANDILARLRAGTMPCDWSYCYLDDVAFVITHANVERAHG